jgi:signal transduction histidine kinase
MRLSKHLPPLRFRFSGRVAKLLGRESVSNGIIAISELVKNAYDADAKKVELIFEDVKSKDGKIRIRDNGTGLSYNDFKEKWMVVGTDSKERAIVSPSGKRRVVGEKGIGRFAVERLADYVTLISNPQGETETITMHIDWSLYSQDGAIFDEIENSVVALPKKDINQHGLEIVLENLRDSWGEKEVEELEKQLNMLVSPSETNDFEIRVTAPDYKKYSMKVESKLLQEAMYEFRSSLNSKHIHYTVRKNGKIVFDDRIDTENVECGPIKLVMYFFPLDKRDEKWTYKVFKLREINMMIKEFGGLKIYRDGFRVKPYGDPNDDWMGLNFKRLRRFGSKIPSNNQIIGYVYISRDRNNMLLDTTTREGLMHNMAYHHMIEFIDKSITAFSLFRQEAEKEIKNKDKPKIEISDNISRLKKIVEKAPLEEGDKKTAKEIIKDVELDITRVEQESISTMQAYRNLAALGITVSSISHEIAAPIAIIMHTSTGLIHDLRNHSISEAELISGLEIMRSNIGKIQEFIQYILGFASATSKKKTILNVSELFENMLKPFRKVLEKRGIQLVVNINPGMPEIRMNRAEFDSMFINLITNAAYFLKTVKDPMIKFTADFDEKGFNFIFSDNGPGIPSDNRKLVFEPFFTTKRDGTGLGLTIVREIVEDNEGSIEIIRSELGNGPTFKIFLPKTVIGNVSK